MAVTYASGLKDSRMTAVRDAVDAGGAAGKLELGTTGMAAVLATITLNYNPCATISSGVLTFSGMPKEVAASGTGSLAAARIRTSANADVVTGLTVGTGSENIVVDATSVTSGQIVRITAASLTHA